MKLLDAKQIKYIDEQTIVKQKLSSTELMDRAARICVAEILKVFNKNKAVEVWCGKGNNGGDGLVIANVLQASGFKVAVQVLNYTKEASADFTYFLGILKKNANVEINEINDPESHQVQAQVVDALLGSGINRPVSGLLERAIIAINERARAVVSVDVPSGMPVFPDFLPSQMIRAQHTFTFQFPKLTFLLPEYGPYVGFWRVLDIGLDSQTISTTKTPYRYLDPFELPKILRRQRFSHKGTHGHVLLIAGSKGMTGAAILSAKAALRTGCGLVTVYTSGFGTPIVQGSLPEAITISDPQANYVTQHPTLSGYKAFGIGPGLGSSEKIGKVVIDVIKKVSGNIVIDADALNAIAPIDDGKLDNKTDLQGAILTPHPGEFDRLFGKCENAWERIRKAKTFCSETGAILILKGAYTAIVFPNQDCVFNSSGCAALAKAGSGDVLTGILTALLGKGYSAKDAAILGVYCHGMAGELATERWHEESVIATDVIDCLPEVFKLIEKGARDD